MNRRRYRKFLLWCLGLDILAMGWLGYRYIDRKVPDEIYVSEGEDQKVAQLLEHPLLKFEDAIAVSGEGSYLLPCRLLGFIPFKDIKVRPAENGTVYASGNTVGIYMETEGVLIIDTGEIMTEQGTSQDPAKNIVKPGDYIVAFNEQKVTSKQELIEDISHLDGDDVTLDLLREGQEVPVSLTPVKDTNGDYKLGIWVRDNTQGIGTLTFVDKEGNYGALGHGISDVDTGELLHISEGSLYQAEVLGIQKGESGSPGELSGLIRYEPGRVLGNIDINSKNGIYGHISAGKEGMFLKKMPVAYKQELKTGPASLLCCVNGKVQEYQAEITRIDMNHEDTNKSFVLHVTDPELLEATGGIVQGMSGSPIIQDGKLVGAVTHVLVNDPTRGYGIFIENMLEAAE
ncbi:MAG: SpoIVB peptidase [Blautia sp.]|uniref:SpoIVB peptidase n=1 Tax=Blautia sp. TaxID=1955243 RepID=UPI002E75F929|nr:SpoIVB peptidase [Blautia sp.]MED9882787.1 SpoIVB peptidase [Blautia sp.]